MSAIKARPPDCSECYQPTDCPLITLYSNTINDKIVLCSDRCLEKYREVQQMKAYFKPIQDDKCENTNKST